MIHPIPLVNDRYQEALSALMMGMQAGGKVMRVCDIESEREASKEERREAQNDLMWAWSGVKAKHHVLRPEYVHGHDKLTILLPMYHQWGGAALRRGEYVQSIIDHVPDYDKKVAVAYDMVRTKNLSVKRMAEYLTQVQMMSAEQGIVLESNSDLEFKNLMVYADEVK